MRTISTGQDTVLRSAAFAVFSRLRVENGSGTLVNLTTYGGRDWFNGAEWGANVDEIVPAGRFYIARSHSTSASGSLAPLIEASTLNVNDAGTYAALLDPGADIYLDTATLAQGSTLPANASTDWQNQFTGTIDSVGFAGPEIEIYARDKIGAVLADRWVEEERPYGTEAGVNIEQVMQDISNDWADGQAVTTPSTPGFLVTTYQQTQQSVLDAQRGLAQLIGWDIRPQWYNTSSALAYVFQEPDRAPSTFSMTFGSSGYIDVRRLDISREDVRNAISVRYTVSSTAGSTTAGTRATYFTSDSTSISRYGRRWMEIDLPDDSDISSTGEAADLGDAALSDLAYPEAEQEIETFYFWPVQLGDYYRFLANGVHYDQPQDWAIYGYRHVLRQNENRTFLQVRGTPAGQYRNWFRRGRITRTDNQQISAKSLNDFRDSQNSTANTVTFTWTRGDLVSEVWIYDKLYAQPEPSNPWPLDSDAPDTTLTVGTDTYTATLPAAQNMRTIQFEPRTSTLEAGPVKRVRLFPRTLTTVDSTDITDGAITADQLIASAQTFGSDIVFSATDNDTVAWTAGTITFASSTAYTIGASNTGNMATTALRYIYLDTNVASTSLQVSANATDIAGDGKTLLAVAAKAPSTAQSAFFVPAVGILGLNGDNLSPSSVTTNIVAANAITAAKINVASLSAISADLGTVTAGTVSAAVIIASSQFTATLAHYVGGITVGSSSGGGSIDCYDLFRFLGIGAIEVNKGRIVEFYSSTGIFSGDMRARSTGGAVDTQGNWTFGGSMSSTDPRLGSRSAASAATAFSATHYISITDAAGNVFFVPGTTAAW